MIHGIKGPVGIVDIFGAIAVGEQGMEDHNGSVIMMTGTWHRKESYCLLERLESSCLSMSGMSFMSFSATTVGGVISNESIDRHLQMVMNHPYHRNVLQSSVLMTAWP